MLSTSTFPLLCCLLLAPTTLHVLAFAPSPLAFPTNQRIIHILHPTRSSFHNHHASLSSLKTTTALAATFKNRVDENNPVEITLPTPDDAASMGIRDWPQQFHSSTWSESVAEGQIATRYVLDGKGRVSIDYFDPYTGNEVNKKARVYPGTLVEVDGEATLVWEVDNAKEGMIVLTPNFEEGGKLALVAGFLVVLVAGLVAGLGGI